MARFKTAPRSALDERAFPIRVLVKDVDGGPLLIRFQDAQVWLNDNVGRGHWAMHGGGKLRLHVRAFYFRSAAAAQQFLQAYPEIELSDMTDAVAHLQAERDPRLRRPGQQDGAHLGVGFKG